MVDLSQTPVLDIHAFSFAAHPWARRDITQLHWLGGVDLRDAPAGTFTDESGEYLEHSIGFRLETRFPLNDERRRHVIIDNIEVNPGSVQEVPALQLLNDNQFSDAD